jgi:hypothetical protein
MTLATAGVMAGRSGALLRSETAANIAFGWNSLCLLHSIAATNFVHQISANS